MYRNFFLHFIAAYHCPRNSLFFRTGAVNNRKISPFLPSCGVEGQRGPWPPRAWGFSRSHTKPTTVGRIPPDEWLVRLRDLYQQHITFPTVYIQGPSGIRTHSLTRRAAADLRFRPLDNWVRLPHKYTHLFLCPWIINDFTHNFTVSLRNELCVKFEYRMWHDYNISRFMTYYTSYCKFH